MTTNTTPKANATYSPGRSCEERVHLHGERNGFRYVEFANGTVTKVPASWVATDAELAS